MRGTGGSVTGHGVCSGARTAKGWSQRRLAEEAHVRQATVSALETADVLYPTLETLDKLAGALDLDVNLSLTSRSLPA